MKPSLLEQQNEKDEPAAPPAIFLSSLGTGSYAQLVYGPHADESDLEPIESRFIQLARLKSLRARGVFPVATYILVTGGENGSEAINWRDRVREGEEIAGLGAQLAAEGIDARPILIPTGADETEFWQIFRIIAELVPSGSDVYVDMTHGFRTLPVLMLMALEYVAKVKQATIKEITYGAHQNEADGRAPTWNLEPFLVIKDWADAVSSFTTYGDTRPLAAVASKPTDELARTLRREMPPELRGLSKSLATFGEAISKCHSPGLPHAAVCLKKILRAAIHRGVEHGPLQPLNHLLDRVLVKLEHFPDQADSDRDKLLAQWAAAHWCFHHNRAIQAMTFLREGIVTALMLALGVTLKEADIGFGWLTRRASRQSLHEEATPFVESVMATPPFPEPTWTRLLGILSGLANLRNQLDHAYNGYSDPGPISETKLRLKALGDPAKQEVGYLDIFREMIECLPTHSEGVSS